MVHRKVRDARLDHAHKTALRLVRDNQAVYAEDLAVSGLMRTRLAKSVSDAGWSQLLRCIEEKAARYVRTFAKVGRFEPTSQVCSACGVKEAPSRSASASGPARRAGRCRPGRERGQEHSRPGAQGEAKRLWNRRKTTAYGGCWC